jgi:uncharacterized protein YaiI (UPF0178 family)
MTSQSVFTNQRGGILKIILIVIGSLALLLLMALIGAGWYGKKKIDEAGGMQAVATKLLTKGVEVLKPEVEKALSAEDAQRFQKALSTLQQKATQLTPDQTMALSQTVRTLSEKMQAGSLSETDAKMFVDELTKLLESPSPELP